MKASLKHSFAALCIVAAAAPIVVWDVWLSQTALGASLNLSDRVITTPGFGAWREARYDVDLQLRSGGRESVRCLSNAAESHTPDCKRTLRNIVADWKIRDAGGLVQKIEGSRWVGVLPDGGVELNLGSFTPEFAHIYRIELHIDPALQPELTGLEAAIRVALPSPKIGDASLWPAISALLVAAIACLYSFLAFLVYWFLDRVTVRNA